VLVPTRWRAAKPAPSPCAHTAAGFTERGLQVWCQRHERNVVHIDFGGHRPEADFRCLEPRTSDADRAH
jgi:hypothetical protein